MNTQAVKPRKKHPTKKSAILAVCAAVGLGLFTGAASAQPYPTKPVRIITPFAAGSGPDSVLRVVGEKLTGIWGQQVIVENRPGGNGFIGLEAAKKAAPDGYTFVQADEGHMALNPHLYKKIPYDIPKDFDPVGTLFRGRFFVVAPANSPWKDMKDLIAAAKAKPGDITYGSWSVGSPGHVGAAMLEQAAGIQMTHIPYKSQSDLYVSVGNGDINWAFGSAGSAGPMLRAGKVKFLATATPQRAAAYPDVPTMKEAGGPELELGGFMAILAPKGTPQAIIDKVNADLRQVMSEPDIRERLTAFGYEPVSLSPAEITREREKDLARYGEIVKAAKISID
jgi:tripartite-type tricarboxylate transporter receptor subunit TctC